ncbi:MAG TPA: peptide-methionine (R)-S-oxide reductase MsrB [Planctomycetota bacterium]|nr:peptide-methionine (R)-S-oxide reductase MsrB [Planctomycetota bacterium]HRR79056.1 peptide-methionine (R)-S-oxide reductase MsrB [Planctomycetota bacterium]HRT93006.1 peptide-methionine (R)-S-oxide reductase MsrB [Planctomycetota bacterium]
MALTRACPLALALLGLAALEACRAGETAHPNKPPQRGEGPREKPMAKVAKTDDEWRKLLTPEQYHILREKGTERAFSGKYDKFNGKGVYRCAGCGAVLFTSEAKYDSGCGWPAYWKAADPKAIVETVDTSHGMVRTEITCARCGGHLGHVFDDGPRPTGLRYCVNSAALEFEAEKPKAAAKPEAAPEP